MGSLRIASKLPQIPTDLTQLSAEQLATLAYNNFAISLDDISLNMCPYKLIEDQASFYHLIDRVQVQAIVERCLNESNASLTLVKASAALQSLDIRISGQILLQLRDLLLQSTRAFESVKSSLTNSTRHRGLVSMASSIWPVGTSSVDVGNSDVDTLSISTIDSDDDVFYDATEHLQTPALPPVSSSAIDDSLTRAEPRAENDIQCLFSGDFVIKQVCLHIQSQETVGSIAADVLQLKIQNLGLKLNLHAMHSNIVLILQQLQVLHVYSGTLVPLLVAGPSTEQLDAVSTPRDNETGREAQQNNAFTINVLACDPQHPDFVHVYGTCRVQVSVVLASMQVRVLQGSLIEIISFVAKTQKNVLNTMTESRLQLQSSPSGPSSAEQHSEPKDHLTQGDRHLLMALRVSLRSFVVSLHTDDAALLDIQANGLALEVNHDSDDNLQISALVSDFALHDLTAERGFYGDVIQLSQQQESKLTVDIPGDVSQPISVKITSGAYNFVVPCPT